MQTILLGILLVNICLVIHITGLADFIPVIDDGVQSCNPDKKFSRMDFSDFNLVTGKDRVYANGTVRFLKDIKSPWKVDIVSERLVNGKWENGFFKKISKDYCVEKNDPLVPTSQFTRHLPNCPIKAGTFKTFNMVSTSPTPAYLPDTFRGEWRLYTKVIFSDSNGQVEDCAMVQVEVMQK